MADGPYLAKLLLEKGYKVFGTYRRISTPNFWRLQELDLINKITLIPADLSDMASLLEAVTISDPDEIYNLAAQSFVGGSFDQPLLTSTIDANGATCFLEIIRHLKKNIKFYQASTSELFGGSRESPQNENTPMVPHSPYAVAKLSSYHMVKVYRHSYGIFACNGILFNHECISENMPLIIRNTKSRTVSIKRLKDIRRAREKGRTTQQWRINNIEIWDGNQFAELQFITATKRKKGDNNFLSKTINTRHGIIEVTNHHNMLDSGNNKIKAEDVQLDDTLLHKQFPFVRGDCHLSKEEALFMGMMVGDGFISKDGRGQFSNNDSKVMGKLELLWRQVALGTITKRKFDTEYGSTLQARLAGNNLYLRYLHNEIYTFDGFKKVPDRILNTTEEIQLEFLAGYNCTDGLKSNPCTYEFKNFKTNSIILAQGLIFLIQQTTKQNFNITFDADTEKYGYYSINLLSPVDNTLKEGEIQKLIDEGSLSQRAMSRTTGISRKFIRKIHLGGHAQKIHHLAKDKEKVKKMFYHKTQPAWVYDLQTKTGRFMGGVGNIVVANSPLRGLEFVTRKITNSAARIKLGLQKELRLGNIHAKRDWGFAPDFVEAMYLLMQQEKPDDYVIATGENHSVGEFAEAAFQAAGLNWKDHIIVDEKLQRPMDVHQLLGNPQKAEVKLGWKPRVTFKELVKLMVEADLSRWQRHLRGEIVSWDAPNHSPEMDIVARNVVKDAQREALRKQGEEIVERFG